MKQTFIPKVQLQLLHVQKMYSVGKENRKKKHLVRKNENQILSERKQKGVLVEKEIRE